MEEKKTTPENKDVDAQVDLLDKEPIVAAMEPTPETAAPAMIQKDDRRSIKFAGISIVVVVVALLGVLYALEKDGRSDTTIFSGIIAWQEARGPLAEVNGVAITNEDVAVAAAQFEQSAVLQGADVTSPQIQAEIQAQSLQLLIRTELLNQAAEEAGVTITEEEVSERLTEIETEAGGAEALTERMQQFEITEESLETDVRSELTIQKLLDEELRLDELEVTAEEVQAAYDEAADAGIELPPFEDIEQQITAQIRQTKENTVVEEYLAQLQRDADIQIKQ